MKKKAIAIYGREFNDSVNPYVESLLHFLERKNITIYLQESFHQFISSQFACVGDIAFYSGYQDLPKDIAFMLSLGGDGTMLSTVSIVRDSGIPITGINFGRLGFLANISKNDIEDAIGKILEGKYSIQPRILLSLESNAGKLFGEDNFALNDVTVFKYDTSAMITVRAKVNGELLNDYWSDGLIIATPTGSTAYSLSCGGPIIMPGSGNFVITPVSPHNLNVRPIVISADLVLDLEIESRTEKYILSCDSRSISVPSSTTLQIKRAPFKINLIRLEQDRYFNILREKLLWGLDVRNY